jgi:carbonic anhydrase
MHFPSEHLVDDVRAKGEMHMVHVDAEGNAASVVGLMVDVAADPEYISPFFDSLPDLIGFNDTSVVEGATTDPMQAIREVGNLKGYWTYKGSLTTPPCSEGLRWFVSNSVLKVGKGQMVKLLESSRFSHRVEQVVWEQGVNV